MESYLIEDVQTGLEPWPSLEEEGDQILDGNPRQSGRVDWGDIEDGPAAGVWSCTPGRFRSLYTYTELCSILAGSVTIETEAGAAQRFGPGDSFFITQGDTVTWTVHETVTKSFMLHVARS